MKRIDYVHELPDDGWRSFITVNGQEYGPYTPTERWRFLAALWDAHDDLMSACGLEPEEHPPQYTGYAVHKDDLAYVQD